MKISVCLLVYNRPAHTLKVLEALKDQGVRAISAYMDAPATLEISKTQDVITDILLNISWAKVCLHRRPAHLGLARSITQAVSHELSDNDGVIVIEDDCLPLPGFMEYQRAALRKYQNDKKIRSICGYQYSPFEELTHEITVRVSHQFNPWGWSTWANRWGDFTLDLESLVEKTRESDDFENLSPDLQRFCSSEYFLKQKADIWSINWTLLHFLTKTWALSPSRSLIRNIGFDGTGVHAVKTEVFDTDSCGSEGKSIILPDDFSPDFKFLKDLDLFLSANTEKAMVKL
jgi:hypothetical protein